jgi:hypothetical protein
MLTECSNVWSEVPSLRGGIFGFAEIESLAERLQNSLG